MFWINILHKFLWLQFLWLQFMWFTQYSFLSIIIHVATNRHNAINVLYIVLVAYIPVHITVLSNKRGSSIIDEMQCAVYLIQVQCDFIIHIMWTLYRTNSNSRWGMRIDTCNYACKCACMNYWKHMERLDQLHEINYS